MSSFYPTPLLETGASLSPYNVVPPTPSYPPDWERRCRLSGLMLPLSKALCDHLVMSQGERKSCWELSCWDEKVWGYYCTLSSFPLHPFLLLLLCSGEGSWGGVEALATAAAAYEILLLHLQQGREQGRWALLGEGGGRDAEPPAWAVQECDGPLLLLPRPCCTSPCSLFPPYFSALTVTCCCFPFQLSWQEPGESAPRDRPELTGLWPLPQPPCL